MNIREEVGIAIRGGKWNVGRMVSYLQYCSQYESRWSEDSAQSCVSVELESQREVNFICEVDRTSERR